MTAENQRLHARHVTNVHAPARGALFSTPNITKHCSSTWSFRDVDDITNIKPRGLPGLTSLLMCVRLPTCYSQQHENISDETRLVVLVVGGLSVDTVPDS